MQWYITSETIHNWVNRSGEWEGYFGSLPAEVKDAIRKAHDEHHKTGKSARELAEELAERFPCLEFSRH